MALRPVSDPSLLARLNGGGGSPQPVQVAGPDPKLPGQVEGVNLNNRRIQQGINQQDQLTPWQVRGAKAQALKAEADLEKSRTETALTPDKLKAVRVDALNKIITARRLANQSRDGWFATGFLAPTAAKIGGTPARSAQAMADTLKSGGALSEILKMTAATGKNPFTPMSNSDVDLISRNLANLDIGQSDQDFQRQVGTYEGAYRRAWKGAKGNDRALLDALNKLGLATSQERQMLEGGGRPAPRPQQASRQQSRVIDFNDLPE